MSYRLGVALAFGFLAHTCAAQTSELDQLLEETGLRQEIFQMPAAIDELSGPIIHRTCPRCSTETIAATNTAFRETFEPAAFYADVRQRFEARYNTPWALEVFRDMESTVYGRMAALDTWADKPENRQRIEQVMSGTNAPPPGKRALLLRQLAQASGSTDVLIALVCQIVRGIAPEPAGCPSFAGPMKAAYTDATVKRWNYVYQNLSDQDLTDAIRIANTPAERWFMATYAQAIGDAFAVRMPVVMSRIARQTAAAR